MLSLSSSAHCTDVVADRLFVCLQICAMCTATQRQLSKKRLWDDLNKCSYFRVGFVQLTPWTLRAFWRSGCFVQCIELASHIQLPASGMKLTHSFCWGISYFAYGKRESGVAMVWGIKDWILCLKVLLSRKGSWNSYILSQPKCLWIILYIL